MHWRNHYRRLLEAVDQQFESPDWPTVRDWLEREAARERVRPQPFVPQSVADLEAADDPALHAGDLVPGPVLVRRDTYRVPPRCRLMGSLYALGTVEVGEGVQVEQDVLARGAIHWCGGETSRARTLVAPRVALDTPAGAFTGGIWCDEIETKVKGVDLPPGLVVAGIVSVDQPRDGRVIVGPECRLGGLRVRGQVETRRHVAVSHLHATEAAEVGRDNIVGVVRAASVTVAHDARVGVVVSESTVEVGKGVTVDTVRAAGDIALADGVTVTGNALLSETGTFLVEPGPAWHSQRTHWFYASPDETLIPYGADQERPHEARLVALRALTHPLWEQVERLSGRL